MIKVENGKLEIHVPDYSHLAADAVVILVGIHETLSESYNKAIADDVLKRIFEDFERFKDLTDEEINKLVDDVREYDIDKMTDDSVEE